MMNRPRMGILLTVVLWTALAQALLAAQAEKNPEPVTSSTNPYAPYPKPDAGYVSDLADMLSRDQEEQIEQWLWQVESRSKVEIIVVLISSIHEYEGTANKNIESFATGLFDKYGIGNKPRNDGILFLVAKNDRKARIELGAGYGRARDGDAAKIMNSVIVPRFKTEDYPGGVTEGVKAIMSEFAHMRVGTNWLLIGILIAIPIVGLITFSLFKSGKRGWGWISVGLLIVLLLAALTITLTILRHMGKGESSGWLSGGSGGFGGGFSGGGGATGSW